MRFFSNKKSSSPVGWYKSEGFQHFPILCRLFRFYCAYGIRRHSGGVVGGNKFYSLIRKYYLTFPYKGSNFVTIPAEQGKFLATVDILDFETFQHSVPGFTRDIIEKRLIKMLFPRNGTFIDIGANYGVFSLHAASCGGDNSKVYIFEPQPRLVEALKRSKAINRFNSITIFDTALSNKEGNMDFYIPNSSGSGSLFKDYVVDHSRYKKIMVKMSTLDKVLEKKKISRIDLIKMDAEGGEYNVIQGAQKILTTYQPFILFEMDPFAQKSAGNEQENIYQILESFGYQNFYCAIDIFHGVKREVRNVDKLTNVLAVPKDKHDKLSSLMRTH